MSSVVGYGCSSGRLRKSIEPHSEKEIIANDIFFQKSLGASEDRSPNREWRLASFYLWSREHYQSALSVL